MSSRKTRHTCRHWITGLRFRHHRGLMYLRRVGRVDINGIDCRFGLHLRLRLLGLLLLILCTVMLIVVDSHAVVRHFVGACMVSRNLAVDSGKFGFERDNLGQCRRRKAALSVGFSFRWLWDYISSLKVYPFALKNCSRMLLITSRTQHGWRCVDRSMSLIA